MRDSGETTSQPVRHGVGPFITWTSEARPSGGERLRTSRRHRKGHEPPYSSSPEADPHRALASVHLNWLRTLAPQRIGWWVAIFFMISALAAFVVPGGGSIDTQVADLGTLFEALCFFIGAYFLIPELFDVAAGHSEP